MIVISELKFETLTEIVTRWETNTDAVSSSVKSIRDKLLPLLASLRGMCITPSLTDVVMPESVIEAGDLEDLVDLTTDVDGTEAEVDDVVDDNTEEPVDDSELDPDIPDDPEEGEPPEGYDTWEEYYLYLKAKLEDEIP